MITNLSEIREQANIVTIIKEFIDLEKSGSSYKASCPFHNEKTASFSVSPSKGIFKCFGCGEGGDAAHFLIEHKGMTLPEAIHEIAKIEKKTVLYDNDKSEAWIKKQRKDKDERDALYPLTKLVADYYQKLGAKSFPEVHEFSIDVWGRTYSKGTIDKFLIGLSKDRADLLKHSGKSSWDIDQLKKIGLILSKDNRDYDFFRNRLIFPLQNHQGKIVGFAGRTKKKTKTNPKYINSPETVLYKKNNALYGLFQNRKAISTAGFAYLVEGYTDVLTMCDYYLDNTVATGGTALTLNQCQLLKRYTSNVTVLRDGDAAGHKAANRDVELLIQVGIDVKVLFFEKDLESGKEHDPDSFLRESGGKRAFEVFSEEKTQDGLLWRSMVDFQKGNPYKLEMCMDTAATLISHIKSEVIRSHYISTLTKPNYFGARKKILQEKIQAKDNKKLKPSQNNKLDSVQDRDNKVYGVYIRTNGNGQIFYKFNKGIHIPLTNFVIIPVYHINSIEIPSKIVTIKNEHGHTRTIDIHTDYFFDYAKFKKKVGEFGNYRFESECSSTDFDRIMAKIIEESEACYKIGTLGWHKKGFWTWANGITLPNGDFQKCTENGLIEFDEINYILPGKTIENENDDSYDDDDTEAQYVDLYTYKKGEVAIKEWMEKLLGVYGDNGLMGAAYYFSSLYRDIIYPQFKFFPHLNLFGPPLRGKSSLAWSLSFMFGQARDSLNLNNFTAPGFNGRAQQIRNGLLWCDEYGNDLDKWKVEILKAAYDGTGREKRTLKSAKSTQNQSTYSAVMISGQDLPFKDIALLTRCITLFFNYQRSPEADKRFDDLRDIEKTGVLSIITSELQQYRSFVEQDFRLIMDTTKSLIQKRLINSKIVESRILINHCIPVAVSYILSQQVEFPKYNGQSFHDALIDFTVMLIDRQATNIARQDEVAGFWKMFNYLLAERRIKHNKDFMVQTTMKLRVKMKDTKRDTELMTFDKPKKVLFFRFTRYNTFLEQYQKIKENGMQEESIKYYLSINPAFIGEVLSKRFPDQITSCYAFDMEFLTFDLPLSKDIHDDLIDLTDEQEEQCLECGEKRKACKCSLI